MEKQVEGKPQISLVVIGHVSSGKSSLTGHLAHKLGLISQEQYNLTTGYCKLHNMEEDMIYAYLLYKINKYNCGSHILRYRRLNNKFHFESEKYHITITDTPGYKNTVGKFQKMLQSTSQADTALLVISAHEFKESMYDVVMNNVGQTREQALIAYSFGIRQIIVAVNKMDHQDCNYSENRYNEIKDKVQSMLKSLGFKPENVTFIPVSAKTGSNLVEKSDRVGWYSGESLLSLLDKFKAPKRFDDLPLRIPIHSFEKISGVGQVLIGRVATGTIKQGSSIQLSLWRRYVREYDFECKSIEIYSKNVHEAIQGDFVGVNIRNVSRKELKRGQVVSDPNNNPARVSNRILAKLIIVNSIGKIREGYNPQFCCHVDRASCRFDKILQKLDKKTGKVIEENPEFLKNGDGALVEIVLINPMVCETYEEFPPLGRFVILDTRQVVAVGVIKKVFRD